MENPDDGTGRNHMENPDHSIIIIAQKDITWKIQMTAELFAMSVHHAHFEKKNGHWPWYITPIA